MSNIVKWVNGLFGSAPPPPPIIPKKIRAKSPVKKIRVKTLEDRIQRAIKHPDYDPNLTRWIYEYYDNPYAQLQSQIADLLRAKGFPVELTLITGWYDYDNELFTS